MEKLIEQYPWLPGYFGALIAFVGIAAFAGFALIVSVMYDGKKNKRAG